MESLLLLNVGFSLDWAWLGEQIAVKNPYTVRVQSAKHSTVNPLLRIFGKNLIPWSEHENASTLPLALHWDITLILSDNKTYMKDAISVVTQTVEHAYRSRYLAVHLGHIDDTSIEDMISFARNRGLRQFSVVRLADCIVFIGKPYCQQTHVTKASKVQWFNLEEVDLSNCTLTAAISPVVYVQFYERCNKSLNLKGLYAPAITFTQASLKFNISFVEIDTDELIKFVVAGKLPVDMMLTALFHGFGWKIDLVGMWPAANGWCVPNICELRDTTYLLWQEFSVDVWILILVSIISVTIAAVFTADTPRLTFGDAFIRVIFTSVAGSVKLPKGHARKAFAGWLWAAMVLTCCYQSILHSMMTAPSSALMVGDLDGLLKSDLDLIALKGLFPNHEPDAESADILEALEERTRKVDFIPLKITGSTFALFVPSMLCTRALKDMTFLPGYLHSEAIVSYVSLSGGSWLTPAFERSFRLMEASGFADRWINKRNKLQTCFYETDGAKPIAFVVVRPAFLLMIGGFSLAIISFLVEFLLVRWKKENS